MAVDIEDSVGRLKVGLDLIGGDMGRWFRKVLMWERDRFTCPGCF